MSSDFFYLFIFFIWDVILIAYTCNELEILFFKFLFV